MKYYSLENILKYKATYNVIIGQRSNGKTYAVISHIIEQFVKTGKQGAYIRRYDEDFVGKRGASLGADIANNGVIAKLTQGEWTGIMYFSSKWYFTRVSELDGKTIRHPTPFMYGFSLSQMEHDKSTSYPNVNTIFFDEFITRGPYLPDEFMLFMNTLSTIIRDRQDVTIFMSANTVNRYCLYFKEMNLSIENIKQGTITLYHYKSNENLTVALEWCHDIKEGKSRKGVDKYFGFDNPKLKMITHGEWEIGMYPRLPFKREKNDQLMSFFISFNNSDLQCEVINSNRGIIIFVHPWTRDIPNDALQYSVEYNGEYNKRRRLTMGIDKIETKILDIMDKDKIFFSSNEVGETFRNYILWSKTDRGIYV